MANEMPVNNKIDLGETGDPNVITALNNVYRPALTAFEQFHRQEHRISQRYRYKEFADRFDKLVDHAHCIRHKVLNRIENLGGEATSEIEPVEVSDGMKDAHANAHHMLTHIQDRLKQALAVAESANDAPTGSMLFRLAKKNQKKIDKNKAWLRQADDLGPTNFLMTGV
jgi:bacterioferritin (cytochrome b1)